MFHDRDRGRRHVADFDVIGCKCPLHKLTPCLVERPEGGKPRLPIGRFPELRRRLAEPLPKCAGKGVRSFVAGIHRYLGHAVYVPVGQPVARQAEHGGVTTVIRPYLEALTANG
jgi:hypothetical protein